jgi:Flp pilus assembly pilin Flp
MNLLRRLWADDRGAVITVEFILIVSILIFGLIPGYVALRNSANATMATIGNLLQALIPNFTFSGFAIGSNGVTIAQVGGVAFAPDSTLVQPLTSGSVAPTDYSGPFTQVDPAP